LLVTTTFYFSYSLYSYPHNRDLHSFPTRRSSDLEQLAELGKPTGSNSNPMNGRDVTRRADRGGALVVLLAVVGTFPSGGDRLMRSEEHTSELQSRGHLVCRLLLEKKKKKKKKI